MLLRLFFRKRRGSLIDAIWIVSIFSRVCRLRSQPGGFFLKTIPVPFLNWLQWRPDYLRAVVRSSLFFFLKELPQQAHAARQPIGFCFLNDRKSYMKNSNSCCNCCQQYFEDFVFAQTTQSIMHIKLFNIIAYVLQRHFIYYNVLITFPHYLSTPNAKSLQHIILYRIFLLSWRPYAMIFAICIIGSTDFQFLIYNRNQSSRQQQFDDVYQKIPIHRWSGIQNHFLLRLYLLRL